MPTRRVSQTAPNHALFGASIKAPASNSPKTIFYRDPDRIFNATWVERLGDVASSGTGGYATVGRADIRVVNAMEMVRIVICHSAGRGGCGQLENTFLDQDLYPTESIKKNFPEIAEKLKNQEKHLPTSADLQSFTLDEKAALSASLFRQTVSCFFPGEELSVKAFIPGVSRLDDFVSRTLAEDVGGLWVVNAQSRRNPMDLNVHLLYVSDRGIHDIPLDVSGAQYPNKRMSFIDKINQFSRTAGDLVADLKKKIGSPIDAIAFCKFEKL